MITRPTAPKRVLALTAIPGELFVQGQIDLRSGVGANTFVFGYTNGYYGYLPDSQARKCAADLSVPGDPNSCETLTSNVCPATPNSQLVSSGEPLCYIGFMCAKPGVDYATAVYTGAGPDGVASTGEAMVATGVTRLQSMQQ